MIDCAKKSVRERGLFITPTRYSTASAAKQRRYPLARASGRSATIIKPNPFTRGRAKRHLNQNVIRKLLRQERPMETLKSRVPSAVPLALRNAAGENEPS